MTGTRMSRYCGLPSETPLHAEHGGIRRGDGLVVLVLEDMLGNEFERTTGHLASTFDSLVEAALGAHGVARTKRLLKDHPTTGDHGEHAGKRVRFAWVRPRARGADVKGALGV
jgi:hypothetical protein